MTGYKLDRLALSNAIGIVAESRGMSLRDVAAETGLSPSTLSRLRRGKGPDVDGLVALLVWANLSFDQFVREVS